MALSFLVVLAAAHLEDLHLVAAAVRDDGGLDARAGQERRAELHRAARAPPETLAQRPGRAAFALQAFHAELLARLDLVLLTAGLDDCVHAVAFRICET